MFGGVDPSKLQGMMKKLGISQEELPVKRVVFEMEDKNLIIEDPTVIKIRMQAQDSYQVSGHVYEEEKQDFSDEDVKLVMEKAKCSEDKAKEALKKSKGDIALAIVEANKK